MDPGHLGYPDGCTLAAGTVAVIIMWTDTLVSGFCGVNDRRLLREALARRQIWYETTLATEASMDLVTFVFWTAQW